jgi:ParB/RepB/Spo0J family partition protein
MTVGDDDSRSQQGKRLLASLAGSGQQTPIVVVPLESEPHRYVVIDGHKRIVALQQLGRDTVEAVIWPMAEAQALVLDRSSHWSKRESALEEGWLLADLQQRSGHSLEELASKFDRSVSWGSRRLALVEVLSQRVQQQVRGGEISAQVATKYLLPVARSSLQQCRQMAAAFAQGKLSTRQAGAERTDASPAPARLRRTQQPGSESPPRGNIRKGFSCSINGNERRFLMRVTKNDFSTPLNI